MSGKDLPPRRIRLCADDYGLSPGVNRAIRDLIARGRLNATSVMVVGPASGMIPALGPLTPALSCLAIGGGVAVVGFLFGRGT